MHSGFQRLNFFLNRRSLLKTQATRGPGDFVRPSPMKSITDFFPTKDAKKRSANEISGPTASTPGSPKRVTTVSEAVTPDGRAQVRAKTTVVLGQGKGTPAAVEAPRQLGEGELLEICERNVGIATVREQQAVQQGTQPALADLLVEETWLKHLEGEFKKPYMASLQTFLQKEWETHKVFPPKHLIFRAMNGTPFDQVRVVIIGQDPYHNDGQAMGMSFSVPPGQPVPSSLQNIYRELRTDCGCTPPKHGDLTKWSHQGVLLLNLALTVRAHEANSHAKKGWSDFSSAAIRALSAKRRGLVFLLWGRSAQALEPLIAVGRHHVLKCAHPSGLSANKGFFGCKHFSKTNKLLEKEGLPQIDWQLPPSQ